jgi:hypothetical protein
MLVTKVSVSYALPNFCAADHLETLSHPNDNGVMPHPAGRVNGQKFSLPQLQHVQVHHARTVYLAKRKGDFHLILGKCTIHIHLVMQKLHTGMRILTPPDIHILFVCSST